MFKLQSDACPCGGNIGFCKATRSLRCKRCKKEFDPHGKNNQEQAKQNEVLTKGLA